MTQTLKTQLAVAPGQLKRRVDPSQLLLTTVSIPPLEGTVNRLVEDRLQEYVNACVPSPATIKLRPKKTRVEPIQKMRDSKLWLSNSYSHCKNSLPR